MGSAAVTCCQARPLLSHHTFPALSCTHAVHPRALPAPPARPPTHPSALPEFLSDLVAIDFTSPDTEAASRQRLAALADAWRERSATATGGAAAVAGDEAAATAVVPAGKPGCGLRKQVALLFGRSLRQVRCRAIPGSRGGVVRALL